MSDNMIDNMIDNMEESMTDNMVESMADSSPLLGPESCPQEDYSIFTILNLCRIVLYAPIILFGSLLGCIAYDYVTFKEEDEIKENETNKKSD